MSGLVRGAAGAAVLSVALAGMALAPAAVASADTQLLPNGTFDGGTTSGWKATNATLSVVTSGFSGDAAKVALTGTATSYSMYASPKPATGLAPGTQLQGSGEVLGISGRSICLMLQEYTSGGASVQTVKGCVTGNGTWQALPATTLTAKNSGDTVGFRITQTGAKAGDSFQADSLSLTESTPPPPPPPPPGVTGNAADWPMQETSGTTMNDTSGHGNNGTLVGPVKVGQPGPAGDTGFPFAYSFPGSSAKSTVDVPFNQALVAGSANIDISFWLNTTHLPSSGDYDLVRMGDYPFPEYKVELVNANQIECTYHHASTGGFAQGGSSLNDGQWHFVQCVKTATQVQVWIDGAEVASKNVTIGTVSPSQDVFIGAHGLPGTSSGFDWYQGELSDVEFSFS
jgi:concanavalin A-like lectin/glucanase superfamily protein